jgi:hypothetical protein
MRPDEIHCEIEGCIGTRGIDCKGVPFARGVSRNFHSARFVRARSFVHAMRGEHPLLRWDPSPTDAQIQEAVGILPRVGFLVDHRHYRSDRRNIGKCVGRELDQLETDLLIQAEILAKAPAHCALEIGELLGDPIAISSVYPIQVSPNTLITWGEVPDAKACLEIDVEDSEDAEAVTPYISTRQVRGWHSDAHVRAMQLAIYGKRRPHFDVQIIDDHHLPGLRRYLRRPNLAGEREILRELPTPEETAVRVSRNGLCLETCGVEDPERVGYRATDGAIIFADYVPISFVTGNGTILALQVDGYTITVRK